MCLKEHMPGDGCTLRCKDLLGSIDEHHLKIPHVSSVVGRITGDRILKNRAL
jgi:hypothetical protein